MGLSSQAPYYSLGSINFGSASPPHNADGFPVSIEHVTPSSTMFGVDFTLDVNLSDLDSTMLPNASAVMTLGAAVDKTTGVFDLSHPVFRLDTVTLSGQLAGVAQISGAIYFITDDPVYGNGVAGALAATFTGLDASVNITGRFGNVSGFNYWFLNASIGITPGFAVGPGILLDGLGGGAYYNMAINTQVPQPTAMQLFNSGTNPGVVLQACVPQNGGGGFNLLVAVSYTDPTILQAYGQIGASFNINPNSKKFSVSTIQGGVTAVFLSKSITDTTYGIVGSIGFLIDVNNKIFDINGSVTVKYPPLVTGSGTFSFFVDPHHYFIKMGQPHCVGGNCSDDLMNNINVENLVSVKSYFEAGDSIDNIPPPDNSIIPQSILEKMPAIPAIEYDPNAGGGLIFGARVALSDTLGFLFFYMDVNAGVGFDVSLKHYTTSCDGSPSASPPGLNGWYAVGNAYAGFQGDFGLQIDMFGYHGRYSVCAVNAAVLLSGGFPNPYWFNGTAEFGYDVLNGLKSGTCEFTIAFGSPSLQGGTCAPVPQVFKAPLVSSISPANKSTAVPINTDFEAKFNYATNATFVIVEPDANGKQVPTTYQIDIASFNVTDNNGNVVADHNSDKSPTFYNDAQGKDLIMTIGTCLMPNTNYTINLSATAQKMGASGKWVTVMYADTAVSESYSQVFTTDNVTVASLIASPAYRLTSYPFPYERYLLPQQTKNGGIVFDMDYSPVLNNCKDSFYARYITIAGGKRTVVAQSYINLTGQSAYVPGSVLQFNIPPSLPNNTLVRLEIVKETKSMMMTTDHGGETVIGHFNHSGGSGNNNNGAGQSRLVTTDSLVYLYYFKTSKFNTLAEKVATIQPTGNYKQDNGELKQVEYTIAEPFDDYDINGFKSSSHNGSRQLYTEPLVSFCENYAKLNEWTTNWAIPNVYQQIYNAKQIIGLYNGGYAGNSDWGGAESVNLLCYKTGAGMNEGNWDQFGVPLRPLLVDNCDPQLTQAEITQEESQVTTSDVFQPPAVSTGSKRGVNKIPTYHY